MSACPSGAGPSPQALGEACLLGWLPRRSATSFSPCRTRAAQSALKATRTVSAKRLGYLADIAGILPIQRSWSWSPAHRSGASAAARLGEVVHTVHGFNSKAPPAPTRPTLQPSTKHRLKGKEPRISCTSGHDHPEQRLGHSKATWPPAAETASAITRKFPSMRRSRLRHTSNLAAKAWPRLHEAHHLPQALGGAEIWPLDGVSLHVGS